jgi:hypothetical protein
VFVAIALWKGWGPRRSPEKAERRWVIAFCVFGIVIGVILSYFAQNANSVRALLLDGPLMAAGQAKIISPDSVDILRSTSWWGLLVGYIVGGFLLAYLAALAIDSTQPMPIEERMTALQFTLVAGAALFTASVLVNKAALNWVSNVLDPASSTLLTESFRKVGDFWGLITSLFLLTAIGTAYFAIADVNPPQPAAEVQPAAGAQSANSVFALKTPDGKDFKALGWLINLLIAFAPAWLSETIFKTVDLFQKNAMPH